MSKVFWVTGLPGSGKTTFACALKQALAPDNAILLDGDTLRKILNNFSYEPEARKELALQYSKLAQMLAEQGCVVIVATVSLFHEIQAWNRAHIPGYIEIFLNTNPDTLIKRNQKDLYQGQHTNVVGRDLLPEYPINPDYTLQESTPDSLQALIAEIVATMNAE